MPHSPKPETNEVQTAQAVDPAAICSADRGIFYDRTKINDHVGRLEKALAEKWEEDNKPNAGLNFGNGTLQDLFCRRGQVLYDMEHEITASERMVAATVVQWLGTNIGRCFIESAFRRAGWSIQMKPNAGALPTAITEHG